MKVWHSSFFLGANEMSAHFSIAQAHADDDAWGSGCDAIAIVAGSTQEDVISFPKSLAVHAGD